MLEELWKSLQQHVLVLKEQLSLHLHWWQCHSSLDILQLHSGETLECWDFLPPGFQQECAASAAFWVKANVQAINSHLSYPWKFLVPKDCMGKELMRQCWVTQVWTKDLGLSQSPSISVWNWEYLLLQTSAACHMRLYSVQLGHSGTPSDALYIFALTDLKGQSMKSMAVNMGQQKRNVFSLSTGTYCHRRLQKQILWMDIKTWTV